MEGLTVTAEVLVLKREEVEVVRMMVLDSLKMEVAVEAVGDQYSLKMAFEVLLVEVV